MKKSVIGILAHVDAGKTTCIESMLYKAGQIRKLGRVDHQNTFLDYDLQERDRGITIYSKQASISWKENEIYLIDTPGHVDFSSEMERTLQVLDMAIILISGQDGVQSHTQTIWKCLEHYKIPTLIFVNKMDIAHYTKTELLEDLCKQCSDFCVDLSMDDAYEKIALADEDLLNEYLETESISLEHLQQAIYKRQCFPVFFGSALKLEGIETLMDAIVNYTLEKEYPSTFGAKVYKITSDEQGNRLTHMKITGGTLKAKEKVTDDEKVDQIRIYNGTQYTLIPQASAGMVCTIKGFHTIEAGQGLGFEKDSEKPLLNAYMNYQLLLPQGIDALSFMPICREIANEDPQLELEFDEQSKTIHLRLMGAIQMEVLQKMIQQRAGITVGFGTGKIIYKETIQNSVIGVGHFEPLRHYAEVVLKIESLPQGSGIEYDSEVSQDDLSLNWQRLILTHLQEKEHRGVLTGFPITDVKITLIAGKAHTKHTEGGDFRQATYRAVRQGLKKANSTLLEPYYSFSLKLPSDTLSKALYDLDCKHAKVTIHDNMDGTMTIEGKGPVRLLMNYQQEVVAYTKGKGIFSCLLDGYYPCDDAQKIIESFHYDSERDFRNPTGSVFCTHGSGYVVPWDEVDEMMHIQLKQESNTPSYSARKYTINEEEVKRVFEMTSGRNKNEKKQHQQRKKPKDNTEQKQPVQVVIQEKRPECLIVDGYNMIYSWDDLKEIARTDFSGARDALIDKLVNYTGYKGYDLLLVFDGYRVKNNPGSNFKKGNTTIVYTRQNQTADSYIEKAAHDLKGKYKLYVATSDGLIQNAILAQGAIRMSAKELEMRVNNINKKAFSDLNSL